MQTLKSTDWLLSRFTNYWIWMISIPLVIYVGLPLLAPLFMQMGWTKLAQMIYSLYSFVCHQYPQRSFFFFGQKYSYSLATIQIWQDTSNPLTLGRFVGNQALGWKVAWSDRMVAMYSSIPVLSWLWYPFRKKIKPLSLGGFFLFLLPMILDGFSHIISDLAGLGDGFRSNNVWLRMITGNTFLDEFYSGTQLGSFNSSMRILSGLLFGIGVVWFFFPQLDLLFQKTNKYLVMKQGSDQIDFRSS